MRSLRAVAGASILLLGVPGAVVCAIVFRQEYLASVGIHVTLGLGFFLFTFAVFDFQTPSWTRWLFSLAIAALAALFSFQAGAEIFRDTELWHLAYAVLGQAFEKWLGYAFLAWCITVLIFDSAGLTRIFGIIVVLIIASLEIASVVLPPGSVPEAAKLAHLPLFVWLLLEGLKRRAPA